jgi:glycosyltransferase involved in cell wall biosynthesis
MRILIVSGHEYPARVDGKASDRIGDWLAKGLAELGHRVFYELPYPSAAPLPEGVEVVRERRFDVDVMWNNCLNPMQSPITRGVPWLTTLHSPRRPRQWTYPDVRCNWVFVSKAHAASFGSKRFVHNGVDAEEFIYAETKDDYFLFAVADLSDLQLKGFETARDLVRQCGIRLVVAGAISNPKSVERYERMFAEEGIIYVGHVSGQRKAELFARARALVFPTRANETFGLVVAEALISGTPVICSDRGACPELVPPSVGFVCSTFDDYVSALARLDLISPLACRVFALERYHYLRMARDYLAEFEKEIVNWASPAWRLAAAGCSRWVGLNHRGRRFAVGVP